MVILCCVIFGAHYCNIMKDIKDDERMKYDDIYYRGWTNERLFFDIKYHEQFISWYYYGSKIKQQTNV